MMMMNKKRVYWRENLWFIFRRLQMLPDSRKSCRYFYSAGWPMNSVRIERICYADCVVANRLLVLQ